MVMLCETEFYKTDKDSWWFNYPYQPCETEINLFVFIITDKNFYYPVFVFVLNKINWCCHFLFLLFCFLFLVLYQYTFQSKIHYYIDPIAQCIMQWYISAIYNGWLLVCMLISMKFFAAFWTFISNIIINAFPLKQNILFYDLFRGIEILACWRFCLPVKLLFLSWSIPVFFHSLFFLKIYGFSFNFPFGNNGCFFAFAFRTSWEFQIKK